MSTVLTYDNPTSGPTSVLVNLLPSIPLEITVSQDPKCRASIELVDTEDANVVQVGPGKGGFEMLLKAVHKKRIGTEIITQILPGAVFSQTAKVSGNSTVIQCGGSMSIGGSQRENGAYITAAIGSRIAVADCGEITVKYGDSDLTIHEAHRRGLLKVEI